MFSVRSDLPLRRDIANRFVVWLVMVLVFMSALAVTVNSYVDVLLDDWNRSVTGTLTVQIPVSDAGDKAAQASAAKVLDVLKRHPAVAKANLVPRAKLTELLKPWLGEGDAVSDLPLPALVDVQLGDDSPSAIAAITASVKTASPSAVIDDHRVWLARVMGLAKGFSAVALAIMILVTAALGLTIIFATRASLRHSHRNPARRRCERWLRRRTIRASRPDPGHSRRPCGPYSLRARAGSDRLACEPR